MVFGTGLDSANIKKETTMIEDDLNDDLEVEDLLDHSMLAMQSKKRNGTGIFYYLYYETNNGMCI
jgi:hypothetical protein